MSMNHALSAVGLKAVYDRESKFLLAYKPVLARILQECVKEFKDRSLTEVIQAINRDMYIDSLPVDPGLTNQAVSLSQENYFPKEGTVYFDLVFSAAITCSSPVRIRINLEAQNDYYPGYDSIERGIFYCARLLSSQAENVFSLSKQEYDLLEKVYSIWIFMHSPKASSDSITSYQMSQKRNYGNFLGNVRYDLLEVISICLNQNPGNSQNELINILSTLFSDKLKAEEKVRKLKSYGVPVSSDYRKEIDHMCNLSEGIHKEGEKSGFRKAGIETAERLLKKTAMNNEEIYDIVSNHVTPEEVEKLRHGEKLI